MTTLPACPHCGAELVGFGRVCRTCGESVDTRKPEPEVAPEDTRSLDEIVAACLLVLQRAGFRAWTMTAVDAWPRIYFAGRGEHGWAEVGRPEDVPPAAAFRAHVIASGERCCVWANESEAQDFVTSVMQRTQSEGGA